MQDCKHNCTHKVRLTPRMATTEYTPSCRLLQPLTGFLQPSEVSAEVPHGGQWQRQGEQQVRKFIVRTIFRSLLFGAREVGVQMGFRAVELS